MESRSFRAIMVAARIEVNNRTNGGVQSGIA